MTENTRKKERKELGQYWPEECPTCGRKDSIRIDYMGAWLCAYCGAWDDGRGNSEEGIPC